MADRPFHFAADGTVTLLPGDGGEGASRERNAWGPTGRERVETGTLSRDDASGLDAYRQQCVTAFQQVLAKFVPEQDMQPIEEALEKLLAALSADGPDQVMQGISGDHRLHRSPIIGDSAIPTYAPSVNERAEQRQRAEIDASRASFTAKYGRGPRLA
jgi:hypothetical protein